MLTAILSRRFLAGWAAGVVSAGAVAGCIGAWMVFGGGFNASASKQHARPVAWATHTAMRNWVKKQARDVAAPPAFTPADLAAGARMYGQHCMACHGGPAIGRARWASALVPTPPYLIDASRHWSREELYVILNEGIKMTAMPAWGELAPGETIWAVVAFLEALQTMPPAEFADRVQPGGAPSSPRTPGEASRGMSPVPLAP